MDIDRIATYTAALLVASIIAIWLLYAVMCAYGLAAYISDSVGLTRPLLPADMGNASWYMHGDNRVFVRPNQYGSGEVAIPSRLFARDSTRDSTRTGTIVAGTYNVDVIVEPLYNGMVHLLRTRRDGYTRWQYTIVYTRQPSDSGAYMEITEAQHDHVRVQAAAGRKPDSLRLILALQGYVIN